MTQGGIITQLLTKPVYSDHDGLTHAIGTAKAMELGDIEGAMSSLSIAVSGLITVMLASVYAQFL